MYAQTVREECGVTGKALAYVSLALAAAVLQPGMEQLAAGYVVYGLSTIMVYTTGHGVHGFTLDPSIGAYVLSIVREIGVRSCCSCRRQTADLHALASVATTVITRTMLRLSMLMLKSECIGSFN